MKGLGAMDMRRKWKGLTWGGGGQTENLVRVQDGMKY